jgi:cation-transporting ATPase E
VLPVSEWILVVVSRPLNLPRLLVIASMYAGSCLLFAVPLVAEFFALTLPPAEVLLVTGCTAFGGMIAIEMLARTHRRWAASR